MTTPGWRPRCRFMMQLRPAGKPRYPEVFGPASETWSANASRQLGVPERAGFRAWLKWRGFALD